MIHYLISLFYGLFTPRKTKEITMDTNTQTIPPQTVLTMRPRTAGWRRPTQVQIPLDLACGPYFQGIFQIQNTHGDQRKVVNAHARGRLNTVKVEIPEIAKMISPVLRFTKVDGVITYEAFDSLVSGEGFTIYNRLNSGTVWGTTTVTRARNILSATWYRFSA